MPLPQDVIDGFAKAQGQAQQQSPTPSMPFDVPDIPPVQSSPGVWERLNSSFIPKNIQEAITNRLAGGAGTLVGAKGLADIPSALAALPDIGRGLISNPIETLRGLASGVAEGAMNEATPLNAAMLALPVLQGLGKSISAAKVASMEKGVQELEAQASAVKALKSARRAAVKPEAINTADSSLAAQQVRLSDAFNRVNRNQRLTARAFTRAGIPIPQDLQDLMMRAARASGEVSQDLRQGTFAQTLAPTIEDVTAQGATTASKMATQPIEVQTADASLTGLMRKLGASEESIGRVRQNLANLEKVDKKAFDEIGQSSSEILLRMASVLGGGAAGAAIGANEVPEGSGYSKTAGAIAGGALGAFGGHALSSLLIPGMEGGSVAKVASNLNYFSLLSSPVTIARAVLGNIQGATTAAVVKLAMGEPQNAAKILGGLLDETFVKNTFVKALTNPTVNLPRSVKMAARVPVESGIAGIPSRIIAAADAVGSGAIMRGGFSRQDALRFSLAGDPVLPWDIAAVRATGGSVRDPNTGRMLKPFFTNEAGQAAVRFLSPFTRLGVNIPERMLEYSPITVMSPRLQELFGHTSGTETMAKAALGPLVGYGAYKVAQNTTPDVDPTISALFGPLAGYAALSQVLARQSAADKPEVGAINQFIQTLPFLGENEYSVQGTLARAVPGIFGGTARAMDPAFGRMSGPSEAETARLQAGGEPGFAQRLITSVGAAIQAKLPVFREGLPERNTPVDVFGSQLYPKRNQFIPDFQLRGWDQAPNIISITLPKAVVSSPIINPPIFPLNNPTAQAVRQVQQQTMPLGEIIAPPNVSEPRDLNEALLLGGMKPDVVPRDIRSLAQRARGAPKEVVLGGMVNSPAFQALPVGLKNVLMRRALSQVSNAISGSVTGLTTASTVATPEQQQQIRLMLQQLIQGETATLGR